MTVASTGRMPIGLKELFMIAGALVTIGGMVTTFKVYGDDLQAQAQQLAHIQKEQAADDLAQQRLADQVEGIKQQVTKVEAKQEQLSTQQQSANQQLFELTYAVKQMATQQQQILEEVQKAP